MGVFASNHNSPDKRKIMKAEMELRLPTTARLVSIQSDFTYVL
jgi:hypothetical protein